mmetsp:Transcript_56806/g.106673  ORF Transcript_56806/g.106673 Transcript_56806/m.106673 type:complete len:261 (+) Transcript_56806:460-1242(+)
MNLTTLLSSYLTSPSLFRHSLISSFLPSFRSPFFHSSFLLPERRASKRGASFDRRPPVATTLPREEQELSAREQRKVSAFPEPHELGERKARRCYHRRTALFSGGGVGPRVLGQQQLVGPAQRDAWFRFVVAHASKHKHVVGVAAGARKADSTGGLGALSTFAFNHFSLWWCVAGALPAEVGARQGGVEVGGSVRSQVHHVQAPLLLLLLLLFRQACGCGASLWQERSPRWRRWRGGTPAPLIVIVKSWFVRAATTRLVC